MIEGVILSLSVVCPPAKPASVQQQQPLSDRGQSVVDSLPCAGLSLVSSDQIPASDWLRRSMVTDAGQAGQAGATDPHCKGQAVWPEPGPARAHSAQREQLTAA